MRSIQVNKRAKTITFFIALCLVSLVVLVPFYIIVLTSLKTQAESMSPVFSWWPKEGFHIDGYIETLFNDRSGNSRFSSVITGFFNTLIIVIPATVVGLLTSSVSAYAFAKINFPFKKTVFTVLFATMLVPAIITLTPQYIIYDKLNLLDTYFPLMVPGMFGAAACVFFMRQYFYGIPNELVEAAKIDGMGHLRIFFIVMMPLAWPGLIAQAMLGFVAGYNDYFAPLLFLFSSDKFTLQIMLRNFISTYSTNWQQVMAGAVIALVPTMILYFFAQRFFIEGIATTGLKG